LTTSADLVFVNCGCRIEYRVIWSTIEQLPDTLEKLMQDYLGIIDRLEGPEPEELAKACSQPIIVVEFVKQIIIEPVEGCSKDRQIRSERQVSHTGILSDNPASHGTIGPK